MSEWRDDSLIFEAAEVQQNGQRLLGPITLDIREARIAVIGCNGAGKSTFLRLAAGLVGAARGQVRISGLDPVKEREGMLAAIGILFQNPDHQIIFPTVHEELAFGLRQQGVNAADAAAQVRAHLEQEGRSDWHDRLVHTLSHGQKQWLCLQAILLMAPRTILLDEPFAALDLPTRLRLARQLGRLKQRLITITHDPIHAESVDRVIWIDRGLVAADGPPALILPQFHAAMAELGALDADPDPSA
ncbi:ABC transporter ATP-binding protein [Paracoccus cavernae]|uniref:ABC transporter ATP-binding protein n=2 Tax=Paracoccus cavernae TaxID=1571207 RepID=A0ABT8D6K0_9RHOB|nr:ABC transporter ATP-binding protein [Paracoccus cavernae]